MADKKKGKGGERPFGLNLLESVGELSAEKVGKPLGDAVINSNPGAAILASHLQKYDVLLAFAPYIVSVFLRNEIPQETVQGFVRGLMQAVKDFNPPADPAQHKSALKAAMEPVFEQYRDALKQKAPPTKTAFTAALQGMQEEKRKLLQNRIAESGLTADFLRLGRFTETSSAELELFAQLLTDSKVGNKLVMEQLMAHLTPPPKPENFFEKARKRGEQFLSRHADKYLDPHGKGLEEFAKEQEDRAEVLNQQNAGIAKIFGL